VDLEAVCTGDYEADLPAFRYFYYVFHRAAFVPDPRRDQTLLAWLRDQSQLHSQRVEADLKTRVFEHIVPYLARGFVHYRRRELGLAGPESPEELREAFGGTVTLLYRLLFLLYAEDRDLLPVAERGRYWERSLTRLKLSVAQRFAKLGDELKGEDSYELWERLRTLVATVRRGNADWNVPRYNGGLFADKGQHNEFLEKHKVPDDYLTVALYHLCREDSEDGQGFIDYKDLDVRQLGSIYEGLLEFHLEWADRDLVVLRDGSRYYYEDAASVTPRSRGRGKRTHGAVSQGELYLVNDKKERRSTGTVFTPEYVVSHIVKKTVGPALDERLRNAETRLGERANGCGEDVLATVFGLRVLDPSMGSGHFLVRTLDYLSDALAEWLATQPPDNPITAVVDEIRTAILDSLRGQRMSEDFISSAEEKLTDNNLLKRLLMKKCLYGVDYNPMAVELAKLSLWLDAFTLGAPLSFLDHHLRCGNSLVGGDTPTLVRTFSTEVRGRGKRRRTQLTFGGGFSERMLEAARDMDELANLTDASFAEVERSAALFNSYYQRVEPYRTMLDLWVSQHFDPELPREQLRVWGPAYAAYLTEGESAYNAARGTRTFFVRDGVDGRVEKMGAEASGPPAKTVQRHIERARELALQPWLRFFHWEIEFPEVYIRNQKRVPEAGFDVVLGNPPYIKYQNRDDTPEFKRWYKGRFVSAHGNYDVYVLFVEQALRLLRPGGRHGYIVYNKWLVSEYGQKLRQLLADRRAVRELVDFGDNQLFPGLTTYTCLLFTEHAKHETLRYTLVPRLGNEEEVGKRLPDVLDRLDQSWTTADDGAAATTELGRSLQSLQLQQPLQTDHFDQGNLSDEPWEFAFGRAAGLRAKVREAGESLGSSIGRPFVGVQTDADDVYIVRYVGDTPRGIRVRSSLDGRVFEVEAGLFLRLVSGEDVERYGVLPTQKRLLFPYLVSGEQAKLVERSVLEERYPLTWRYIAAYRDVIAGRGGGRLSGDRWYAYVYPKNLGRQRVHKLLIPRLVDRLKVAPDFSGEFALDNVDVSGLEVPTECRWYLLALLNFRLLDWFFKAGSARFQNRFYSANRQFVEGLPIHSYPGPASTGATRSFFEQFMRRLGDVKTQGEADGVCHWLDTVFAKGAQNTRTMMAEGLTWLAKEVTTGTGSRQRERGAFLHWLSAQVGADWEDLSGKTNLARYDEHEFNEVWDILGQPANVARYKANAQRGFRQRARSLRESAEREHEKSVKKLRRHKAQLDRDQHLIDHIVYRLYGLTDDEIAIVEAGP